MQLCQSILRIGIAEIRGEREPLDRFRNILRGICTGEIQPAKLLGGVLIFLFCGGCGHGHWPLNIIFHMKKQKKKNKI